MFTVIRRMMLQMKISAENRAAPLNKGGILRFVFGACCSFLFTRLRLLGNFDGLGFAFAAALPLPFSVSGLIGCFFGELFDGLDQGTFFYLILLGIWFLARRAVILCRLPKHFVGLFWQSVLLGSILLLRAVFTYFMMDLPLMEFLLLCLQGIVQLSFFSLTVVFSGAFFTLQTKAKKIPEEFSGTEALSAVVIGVLLIAALGRYRFGGFSLAGIAAVTVSAVFAYRYGWLGGAASGILCGIGLVLYDAQMIEFAAMQTVCVFFAGWIARRSKLLTAVGIMVIHFVLVLLYGKPVQMMPLTFATLIGAAAFLTLPQAISDAVVLPRAVFGHDPPDDGSGYPGSAEEPFKYKTDFAADAMEMLNESVGELAQVLRCDVRPDPEMIYQSVENTLCSRCKRRFACYGEFYDRVREDFNTVGTALRHNTLPTPEEFPQFLRENCIRSEDLIRVFTESYERLRFASEQQRQVSRLRELLSEQYITISEMLKGLHDGIRLTADRTSQEILEERLSKEGYAPGRLFCGRDKDGRLFIDLYYDINQPPSGELVELAEKYLKKRFAPAVIADAKSMVRISLYESPPYGVGLATKQQASQKNAVCGDTVTQFYDGRGGFYLLLSDGMGQGRKAALDSRTVCTILSKLIVSGFTWQTSMRLLNTILSVKSASESLATVDIIYLDLYSGEAEFIKAGAASSFWVSDKNVTRIRSFTLPLGIVSGIRFDSKKITAMPGDTLLLLSDGIEEEENRLAKVMFDLRDKPLDILVDRICALEGAQTKADDKTAAAIRLIRYDLQNGDGS